MVVEERGLRVERRRVVVGIGVVREPAELELRVLVGGIGLAVLVPLARLQGHVEEPAVLELVLDLRVLVGRAGPVVRGRPPDLEVDGCLHARLLKLGLGRVQVGRGAVLVLERLRCELQALRDHGVQGLHRPVVDVGGDRLAVNGVSDGSADGELLRVVGARLQLLVEDQVADLDPLTPDDADAVGAP